MSRINNHDQNRPGSTGFPPVSTNLTSGTVERRGLVLTHADELLQMTLELLRVTIELLHILRMTFEELWRDAHTTHLKPSSQQL